MTKEVEHVEAQEEDEKAAMRRILKHAGVREKHILDASRCPATQQPKARSKESGVKTFNRLAPLN